MAVIKYSTRGSFLKSIKSESVIVVIREIREVSSEISLEREREGLRESECELERERKIMNFPWMYSNILLPK